MSTVKLKSTGRIGQVVEQSGEYRTVVFPKQGNECSRNKMQGVVQSVHHSKLNSAEK
jgi:hypothetical protein